MNGLRKDTLINSLQSQVLPGTKNWTLTESVFSHVLLPVSTMLLLLFSPLFSLPPLVFTVHSGWSAFSLLEVSFWSQTESKMSQTVATKPVNMRQFQQTVGFEKLILSKY